MKRKFWLLRGLRFVLFAALFIAAVGLFTQYLWNALVPTLFHGPLLTLGQTFGLLLLTRLLFGSWGGRGGGSWAQKRRAWQQRMAGRMETLSPEAREKFRQQMQARCGGMGWMRPPAEASPAAAPAQQPA